MTSHTTLPDYVEDHGGQCRVLTLGWGGGIQTRRPLDKGGAVSKQNVLVHEINGCTLRQCIFEHAHFIHFLVILGNF